MAQPDRTTGTPERASRAARGLDAVLAGAAVVAAASWVVQFGQLEHGAAFAALGKARAQELVPRILAAVQWAILGLFVLDRLARAAMARGKADYLRGNWFEFALIAAGAAIALARIRPGEDVRLIGLLYLVVMQGYAGAARMCKAVGDRIRRDALDPGASRSAAAAWVLAGSFLAMVVVGALLLFLPAAVDEKAYFSWDFIDALFTATSAATCTGLTLKALATQFTFFGQVVILLLVQCGALAVLLAGAVLGWRLTRRNDPEPLGQAGQPDELARAVRFVLTATLAAEALGAMLLTSMFWSAKASNGTPLAGGQAVWYAVFHSVSAFCNAGFTLYKKNLLAGTAEGWAVPLRDYWQVHGVIAPLILLGGLGTPVLRDLWTRIRPRAEGSASPRGLTSHTKIVLTMTAVMVAVGAAGLMLIESAPRDRSPEKLTRAADDEDAASDRGERRLSSLPPKRRLQESVFQAISARSAGFNTVETASLSPAGTLWLCGLIGVGGAPGGTAGGMKVTTLAVLVLAAWQAWRRPAGARRVVGLALLRRAVLAAVLYAGLLGTVTLLVAVGTGWDSRFLLKILLESCSACGNSGVTAGLSEGLGRGVELVKGSLMAGMFLGRIGVLALMLAAGRESPEDTGVVV